MSYSLSILIFAESQNYFETMFKKPEPKTPKIHKSQFLQFLENFIKMIGIFTISVKNVQELSVQFSNSLVKY